MAEIYQVLWSLAVRAAEHHDAQLVGDSLRYMEPAQLGVQEPRQATVNLGCTADHSSCGVQHSLQLVSLLSVRSIAVQSYSSRLVMLRMRGRV